MRNYHINKSHDCRGMTLVELLVVMAILSVVMMAVVSLYIPVVQSTAAQTQVSDVQSNLRLALKIMTRDLLTAGFLVANDPIAFPGADPDYYGTNLTSRGPKNATDFIIRTRIVGDAFARVSGTATGFNLTVTEPGMLPSFPKDSKVRLFHPITTFEVFEAPIVTTLAEDKRVYTVISTNTNPIQINTSSNSTLVVEDIPAETIMVRVKDQNQPALQTIRYRLNNGSLERIVNDVVQTLARNIDSVNFVYVDTPQGRVKQVDITLTGKTKAIKNDALSGEKTRSIKTSVKLRNVQ